MIRGSYEYYILDVQTEDLDELEKQLNDLGAKGWYLKSTMDDGNTMIFVRQSDGITKYTGRRKLQPEPEMPEITQKH